MARKSTKGTTQLGAEVETGLAQQFREFARSRGETLRQALESALRRHMAYPPPPPVPPPPPTVVPFPSAEPAPKGRGKK